MPDGHLAPHDDWQPHKGDRVYFTGLYPVVPGPGDLLVLRAAADGSWVDLADPASGARWGRHPTCAARQHPTRDLAVCHPRPAFRRNGEAMKRAIPQVRCARCPSLACVELVAVPPRNGGQKGPYPKRQALCPACIVFEARLADSMGYLPVGEPLCLTVPDARSIARGESQ